MPRLTRPTSGPVLYDDGQGLAIHMETGEFVSDYGSTPPQEYDHFRMLIQYRPTIGKRVGLLGNFFVAAGVVPWKPTPDSITLYPEQEWVEGFINVDASQTVRTGTELGIRYDREKGTLGPEFISCRKVGSVPNPGCSFYLYERGFRLKLGFNRLELHRLKRIEELARQFINCSLQRGKNQ